jgi:crotonobetainyl-CoA:carnitine CoA-transferase CaiB-like acyl-CoA transferase
MEPMTGALAHLQVLELCDDLPGAFCARQFAAWGAEVIVLEPPGGTPLRRAAPRVPDDGGVPVSLLWEYVAANKRTTPIDPHDPAGRGRLRDLLVGADVLVTDWAPARLAAAGLDLDVLAGTLPGLVLVSVTPFGLWGPYAGYAGTDLVVQALSGMLSLNGLPERAPLKAAGNVVPFACGVSAFVGALAALYERGRSGRGQLVEVACLEAVASLLNLLRVEYTRTPFVRRGGSGPTMFPCRDGWIACNPGVDRVWDDLLVALNIAEADVPAPLRTPAGRQDTAAVARFLAAHTAARYAAELFEVLGRLGVVAGLLRTPRRLLDDPHLQSRGFFRTLVHPRLGALRFPGPPARLSATPMVDPRPVVQDEGGRIKKGDAGDAARRTSVHPASDGPLAGVHVVDLTQAWVGPYATMLLADLGADVIKVEAARRPDVWRSIGASDPRTAPTPGWARPEAHPWNVSFLTNSVTRNKRGLALDLDTEEGKTLLLRLVRRADLVMENYTPRVMDNFGLGYERLRAERPDLVMVSFSGYGRTGPYRDFKANGATIETIAGWVALFGYPDTPPMTMGNMQADPITGLQMAATALVALLHRDRTGQGQHLDGSMFEAAVGYIGEEILHAGVGGDVAEHRANRHPDMAPHGAFPGANDGGRTENVGTAEDTASAVAGRRSASDSWVAIAVRDDADWERLRAVAADAAPWLQDARFATAAGRLAAVDELEERIGRWTARYPAEELMERLQAAGIPAGVVRPIERMVEDPHLLARRWFQSMTHPDTGTHRYNGFPWRFSRTPAVAVRPPPRIGEHSEAILVEELGLSEDEYRGLVARGITGPVLRRPAAEVMGRG